MQGKVLRFAIGTPEAHGAEWRIWQSGPADDMYIGTRFLASSIQGERARVGRHQVRGHRPPSPVRQRARYPRSAGDRAVAGVREVQPGVFRIVTIVRRGPQRAAAQRDDALSTATGWAAENVHAPCRAWRDRWTTSGTAPLPMGPIHLPSGQAAWLVGAKRPLPDALLPDLKRARSIRVHDKDGTRLTGIRTLVVGVDGDGVGTLTEFAAPGVASA